ncbi:hypothetical protein Tcan_16716 [Toxocara canis]|uniref:Uncharacterized protein n=1 Tax=Toxocara canis TaxID=6265 RepID=A0A0B2VC70_TOXCA|nr:hypothetical protein Tcan_16716 [Toxocara canis]
MIRLQLHVTRWTKCSNVLRSLAESGWSKTKTQRSSTQPVRCGHQFATDKDDITEIHQMSAWCKGLYRPKQILMWRERDLSSLIVNT